MNTQPAPTPKPLAPCPTCGAVAWHRVRYAPAAKRNLWYCGACGEEYAAWMGKQIRHCPWYAGTTDREVWL
jgi:transcription elongation factor Elf1